MRPASLVAIIGDTERSSKRFSPKGRESEGGLSHEARAAVESPVCLCPRNDHRDSNPDCRIGLLAATSWRRAGQGETARLEGGSTGRATPVAVVLGERMNHRSIAHIVGELRAGREGRQRVLLLLGDEHLVTSGAPCNARTAGEPRPSDPNGRRALPDALCSWRRGGALPPRSRDPLLCRRSRRRAGGRHGNQDGSTREHPGLPHHRLRSPSSAP
jgi:hypothetical protein